MFLGGDVDRAGGARQAGPDIYLAVTAALGCPPPDCAAVEDSSNGLRSAAAAGLRVIAIPQPQYPPDPDALAQASLVLPSLAGLTADAVAALAGLQHDGRPASTVPDLGQRRGPLLQRKPLAHRDRERPPASTTSPLSRLPSGDRTAPRRCPARRRRIPVIVPPPRPRPPASPGRPPARHCAASTRPRQRAYLLGRPAGVVRTWRPQRGHPPRCPPPPCDHRGAADAPAARAFPRYPAAPSPTVSLSGLERSPMPGRRSAPAPQRCRASNARPRSHALAARCTARPAPCSRSGTACAVTRSRSHPGYLVPDVARARASTPSAIAADRRSHSLCGDLSQLPPHARTSIRTSSAAAPPGSRGARPPLVARCFHRRSSRLPPPARAAVRGPRAATRSPHTLFAQTTVRALRSLLRWRLPDASSAASDSTYKLLALCAHLFGIVLIFVRIPHAYLIYSILAWSSSP